MTAIDPRHYQVLLLISQFKQLPAAYINELLFHDKLSIKPCYRVLDQLYERGLLNRIEHRLPGGRKGGSNPFVWILAPEGRRVLGVGGNQQRTANDHTIEIANTYRHMVRLEREHKLEIVYYLTEPTCHERIGDQRLEPDLYVELLLADGRHKHLWCEIDMARKGVESEGRTKIKDKLARYWHTYTHQGDYWPPYLLQRDAQGDVLYDRYEHDGQVMREPLRWFPTVIWIAQDEYRRAILQRIINEGERESRELFKVMLLEEYVAWLG